MRAWWSGSGPEFLVQPVEAIVGALSVRLVESHPANRATQIDAWRAEIPVLQSAVQTLAGPCRVLLEYPILRLGRRIDAVVLTESAILVLEFKVGAVSISNADREQVEDYALDLFDFHATSRSHPIIPILVATEARHRPVQWPLIMNTGVTSPVLEASAANVASLFASIDT